MRQGACSVNFYKRFMGDMQSKTGHLSLAEFGAYDRLLDHYYSTEQALPGNLQDCFRIARAMSKDEKRSVEQVLREFFTLEDGLYRQRRADEMISEAQPKIAAAKTNGAKGGRPKSLLKEPIKEPTGFLEITQSEPSGLPSGLASQNQNQIVNTEAKASLSSAELPDCPHELLIDLFEKHLPTLAQPKKSLWRAGKNAPALKARWRWVLTAMHEKGERKGQRLATTKDEAIAWFERYFAYVARSEFLTGASSDWACDLGWLVNAANFEKVLSGNYENKLKAVA